MSTRTHTEEIALAVESQALWDSPLASAYETTEEARMLLRDNDGSERAVCEASVAAAEAAYYLSDTFDPDVRASLLSLAETRLGRLDAEDGEGSVMVAQGLLGEAASEVKTMLRGPIASSELRIASRALQRAIADLSGSPAQHLAPAGSAPRAGTWRRRRA
jgi:hypothetical protein